VPEKLYTSVPKLVALPEPSTLIDLHALRLGDACALLGHSGAPAMQLANESAPDYMQRVIDSLCELSLKDPLTGLANRRSFMSVLEREIAIVERSGDSTLLLMLDIDHFKNVNDGYGHLVGDRVLQAVGEALSRCVRPKDTVVRYGGEEFAVVLPDCHVTYGIVIAERMRETVQKLSVAVAQQMALSITVSIGGAYASQLPGATAANWIARADKELYRAKSGGRNRVCIDQPVLVEVSAEEKSQLFVDFSQNDSIWSDSVFVDPIPEVADETPQPGHAPHAAPGASPPQNQAAPQGSAA
jgi:diguanylate cyclase (GGDEF)-like protein